METENDVRIRPVAGYHNGLFTRDIEGAMAAVIVNPTATHSQRIAWALGQLALLKTVAEAADPADSGERGAPLAYAVRQLLEQAEAVLLGVLEEMENPPKAQQLPLRVV
jgi:hypothetical protein